MKFVMTFSFTALLLIFTTTVYCQQILCSFETEKDRSAVLVSDGVRITRSTDYAALNAHSLKCAFPAKGGSVAVGQFTIPSWTSALGGENAGADALLFFIWAETSSAVYLEVEDSLGHVAGDRFMLKAGANHIQLAFSQITGVNTEKIKLFRIICTEESTMYMDYVALDRFQEVLNNNGRWDVAYTSEIPTKHFPWGTDFINGAIKTFSISPVFDGRGIIELSERLSVDHHVVTIGRDPGINRWGFGDFYNRRNPMGDDGDHPYSLAFNYIADDLLSLPAQDVIIWPGLHPWESYPKYIRDSVMNRVREGTGLVLIYPSGADSGDFSGFSPLTLEPSVNTDSINALNRKNFGAWGLTDTSAWVKVKDHYITRGVELNAFPFGSIGVLPFNSRNNEVLLASQKGNPVMAVKQYGKGRIVAMSYLENGFIPKLKDPWETGLHNSYWEYMWSLVARSVIWAAAKEPQTYITRVTRDSSLLNVTLNNIQEGDSLSWSIEDAYGVPEYTFSIGLKSKQAAATISLPGSLHGGSHLVNFQLKSHTSKVYDWYSLQFNTVANAAIVSITNGQLEVSAGDTIRSTVLLSARVPFKGVLTARLYDNYNRLVDQKNSNIEFNDRRSFEVSLDSKNILSHLGRVEFFVMENNRELDHKTKDIFFLQPRKWDDYDVTLYHFGPNPVPGTWPAIDSQLQNMQVTTLAAYTIEQSRHANYKVQAQTRISGMESPDSGPDLNYYDSVKSRYLETKDKKVLVRKYGLNDSAFLHSVKEELIKMVPPWRKFSPSAYYIYEEPSVTRYDDALDFDFSDITLNAMRKWLQEKYASIAALNHQWGSSFLKWEEVVPDDSREARKRGNYSSWADHRSFMEKSWAAQFKYVQDALRELDPGGLVQLSGTQASGAHNGYDYSQINQYVGQMNPYDIGNQLEYHHDFNPSLKISGQAGYGASGKSVLFDFYQHIFVNETGGAYIFWQQSALNPDLQFCKSGADMKAGFTEMRERGIGKLVASYRPENDNRIAIHYSYPSIHAAWIVDGRIKSGRTYGNTSETLEQFRRNLDGWVKILQDAGLGFDFTAYSDIEKGDLMTKGFKVLILPMSAALSDKEVSAIERFVENGGTVICDGLAGIMDDHTKFREKMALAGVFGIKPVAYTARDLITPSGNKKIVLRGARSLSGEKNNQQLLYHAYGTGKAFMLNYFMDNYPELKTKQEHETALTAIRKVFSKAGITSSISLTDINNKPVAGVSMYSFSEKTGAVKLLGLLPGKSSKDTSILIHLDTISHVYDVRSNQYLGKGKNINLKILPWVPSLLAIVQGTIDTVKAVDISAIPPGGLVRIRFSVGSVDSYKLNSVASVAVYDGQGRKKSYYSGNCTIDNNQGVYEFGTALNDREGKWKVVVTEVISGKSATLFFNVKTITESLLPVPQKTEFTGNKFTLDKNWTIHLNGIQKELPAVSALQSGLMDRYKLKINIGSDKPGKAINLIIREASIVPVNTTDTNFKALSRQAYKLELKENNITISANAAQGLYYGVQSLLQLLEAGSELSYPEGALSDWPEMDLRMIYWDDAHHLEKLDVLKREIKQASYFKINGFALKLEGHFQFKTAPSIVEPHALSAAQYQELTDYAAAHYVQLIPYLDAPAHVAFILKHPAYKDLRAFPLSNYQFTVNNPKTYQLLSGMFKELIDANKGVDYVLLSSDEAYYTGKAANEMDSAKALGGNGKLLARFIGRMADTLKTYGRKVIFWGEYPLVPDDISRLPQHLVNGVYDSDWARYFKQRGIRQLIYTSIQGEEPLFPNYYPLAPEETLHAENGILSARVPDLVKTITQAIEENRADLSGVIVAGWADAGLHPGTFWLGYATGAAMGWNHSGDDARGLSARFYDQFYKTKTVDVQRIYELTSRQAQFYEDSWEWKASNSRTPIFGNHAEIYKVPKPASDQTLLLLPVPDADKLSLKYSWSDSNYKRLELATLFLKESNELMQLLDKVKQLGSNRENMNVIRSVALLCRQNLTMLTGLKKIDMLLKASSVASASDHPQALYLLDQALDISTMLKMERNIILDSAVMVWYNDWLPLVPEANGRKYLHAVDDVKDHRPLRKADMSYLIYRELNYPMDSWAQQTVQARNNFATKHALKSRAFKLNWKEYIKRSSL